MSLILFHYAQIMSFSLHDSNEFLPSEHKQDLTVLPRGLRHRSFFQRSAVRNQQTRAAIRVCKCRECLNSPMVVCQRWIGTQTRPDSAPNGSKHQEDCFATHFFGSDVARFSAAAVRNQQTRAAIRVCKCRECLDSPMVVCQRWIGTQTRPDSAPNGSKHQEDCFATHFFGSDVARFSAAAVRNQQTRAAIRVCKCRECLDSPMVVCQRWIGTQTRPDSAPNGSKHQEDCFATHFFGSDVARFSAVGRSKSTNSGGNSCVQVS